MNCKFFIFIVFIFTTIPLLTGCGTSSPRFGVEKKKTPSSKTAESSDKGKNGSSQTNSDKTNNEPATKETSSVKRDFRKEKNPALKPLDQSKLMRQISRYMGVSYKLGGETSDGMDCSGYTMVVYRDALGIKLPRSSSEQTKIGKPVDFKDLKFGDLIFFNTTGESASHVGIYLGDDLFAHASITLGVTISTLVSPYFKERYECARRIVDQ